jgi:hypothetical protein
MIIEQSFRLTCCRVRSGYPELGSGTLILSLMTLSLINRVDTGLINAPGQPTNQHVFHALWA